jgi:hypothetical protein
MTTYFIGQNTTDRNAAISSINELHSELGLPLSDAGNGGPGFSFQPDEPHPDPLTKGNLGDANSSRRELWLELLEDSNRTIQRAADLFSNTPLDFKQQIFPEFNIDQWDTSLNFATTDLEQFNSFTRPNAERFFWSELEGPPTYTVRNLILIYQALMGDFSYDVFPIPPGPDRGFPLDGRLGRWTPTRVENLLFVLNQELDLRQEAVSTATLGIDYKDDDISFILNDQNFDRFFSTTFDSDTISLIPLIHNFYLTSEYFQGINNAFIAPKDRVLSILLSTIANDNNFDSTPDLSRPASNAAVASSTGQDQNAAFNSAARDFILKMIIKTPIDILKGLTELIDPHVAISKVIKTGTGFAFNELAAAIDPAVRTANEQITIATENLDLPIPIEPNLTGEDLLSILFCLVENGMNAGLEGAEGTPAEIPENFFPRISIDGVDFTGTVSGMLMMPPSPLGLIYLLLELLKNDITNQTQNVVDASAQNANENECSDQVDPVTEESPCGDTEEQT